METSNFEPEPVEDLKTTDEREPGEEPHHAAHPGDLVREGHPGALSDLLKSKNNKNNEYRRIIRYLIALLKENYHHHNLVDTQQRKTTISRK